MKRPFIPGHVFKNLFLGAFDKLVEIHFGAKSLQFTPRCQFKNLLTIFFVGGKSLEFGGNTLDFMTCSPNFFVLSTKYEFKDFPSSASIFCFFSSFTSVRNV